MKIIFVDFDGVLNGRNWTHDGQKDDRTFCYFDQPCDPKLVERLNQIILATRAYVVVSSTWRKGSCLAILRNLLVKSGFKYPNYVIDITPSRHRTADGKVLRRGHEIQAWLDAYQESGDAVDQFVILDDDSDMEHLIHRLIQPDGELGLDDDHVAKAIEMLMEVPNA